MSERPDPHLESEKAAHYKAHKAAEEAFMAGEDVMRTPPKPATPEQESGPKITYYQPNTWGEDPDTLVLRIKKAEQVVTLSFLTKKDKEVSLSIKVISLEETDTSYSLILPQDTLIKLPVLETFKLTLQNGSICFVSFLGGEGTIGNCKCIWLIKTNLEKYE